MSQAKSKSEVTHCILCRGPTSIPSGPVGLVLSVRSVQSYRSVLLEIKVGLHVIRIVDDILLVDCKVLVKASNLNYSLYVEGKEVTCKTLSRFHVLTSLSPVCRLADVS